MYKWQKFSQEELKEIFENSVSYKQIAEKLGYSYCGKSLNMIKKIAQDYNFQLNLTTKTKEQKEQDKMAIIGKTFGRLTVLDFDIKKTNETKRTYFICQCSCENKTLTSVRMDGLLDKNNPIQSCGCLQKEAASLQGITNREDFSNQTIGKLKILCLDEEKTKDKKVPYWICKCECGRTVSILASSLRRGQQSCGCLKSNAEFVVRQLLDKLNITYEVEKTFNELVSENNVPLRFDFYLPKYNLCIECQGQQHYFPVDFFGGEEKFVLQKKYDELKKQYCKNNNIQLLLIPYTDYNIINEDYIKNKISDNKFDIRES